MNSFVNGQKPTGEWHAVAKDSWMGAGPVNIGLLNKADYKAMQQAFDSLPLPVPCDRATKRIMPIIFVEFEEADQTV